MLKTTFIISSIVSVFLFSSCKKTKDLEFTPLSKSSAKTEVKLNEGDNLNFKYTDFYDDGSEYTDYETDSTSNLRTAATPKRIPYQISLNGKDLVYVSPKEGVKTILRSQNGKYALRLDSKGNLFCYFWNSRNSLPQGTVAVGVGCYGLGPNQNLDLVNSYMNYFSNDHLKYYWYVVKYIKNNSKPYSFSFHKKGNLALRDYKSFKPLWVMQSGEPRGAVKLELRNNGNLVLFNVSEEVVWRSDAYWEN